MADRLSPRDLAAAEAAVEALDTVDTLLSPETAGDVRVVPFSDYYAYATDPAFEPGDTLLIALETDANARAGFEKLLRNTATIHLPIAAAASSGDLEAREAGGCKLSFRDSRAEAGQIYIIIEPGPGEREGPRLLFVRMADGRTQRLELPAGRNGRIQVLLERDSDMARALRSVESEVYLT